MKAKVVNSEHVMRRIGERIPDKARREELYRKMVTTANALLAEGVDSVACRFIRTEFQGKVFDNKSNGDCGVFVMRDGCIITFMWRRSEQPHIPSRYRTKHTMCLNGTCSGEEGGHIHSQYQSTIAKSGSTR